MSEENEIKMSFLNTCVRESVCAGMHVWRLTKLYTELILHLGAFLALKAWKTKITLIQLCLKMHHIRKTDDHSVDECCSECCCMSDLFVFFVWW